MHSRIRLGAVSFLNAKPLVYGLTQGLGADRIALTYDVPSALAIQLAEGELDGALLPSIELCRIPGLVVLPGISIASRGPAASVLLVSKCRPEEVDSVSLDPESRTTNAMVQILFDRVWGRTPTFHPGPPGLDEALRLADAAVRIGDKALFDPRPDGLHVQDLGAVWTRWTGAPFVYAVWALFESATDRGIYELLHASRRRGVNALERIAAEFANDAGRDETVVRDYLSRNMVYRLGAQEWDALRAFLSEAARLSLVGDPQAARLASFREAPCGVPLSGLRPATERRG